MKITVNNRETGRATTLHLTEEQNEKLYELLGEDYPLPANKLHLTWQPKDGQYVPRPFVKTEKK